jgi:hypothetical protein
MTDLRPCSGCRRHVSIAERVCPFCSAELALASPRDPLLGRMSRAAVFAGAALATSACGGKKAQPQNVDNQQAAQQDAGTEAPPPPPDNTDPNNPNNPNNVPMPYGAPPARRRVV